MTTSATASPFAVRVALVGSCPASLWGISNAERLRRQFRALGVADIGDPDAAVQSGAPVLLLRADYLFESKTLADLLAADELLLCDGGSADAAVVAARSNGQRAAQALEAVQSSHPSDQTWNRFTPESLSASYVLNLSRAAAPRVTRIDAARTSELEAQLFGSSYKGITDLVTKFVWPRLARYVTKVCTRHGVTPNMVTFASLLLVIGATYLFLAGHFLTGLVLAWAMTFLDTVDGKLARVTVTSTPFGNIFDHSIDLVGPPVWYVAWAFGLADATFAADLHRIGLLELILVGYLAGRFVEGAFDWGLAHFPIFVWRPVDSWVRLITARRNPNLIFLTLFTLADSPTAGLYAVGAWTIASSVFLLARLASAVADRMSGRTLVSWIQTPRSEDLKSPLARPFL